MAFTQESTEFIDLVNARIQNLKKDLNSEKTKTEKLQRRIDTYMEDANKKDKILARNFQKLVETETELNKKDGEILRLSNDLKILSEQDSTIKRKLNDLDSTKLLLDEQVRLNQDYISSLTEDLEAQNKQTILEKARADKLLKTLQNYDRNKGGTLEDLLYFLETGGKNNAGFTFHLIGGTTFDVDKKLFIGLGLGFNDNHTIKLSTIPVYVSFRAILNNSSFEFPRNNMGERIPKKHTFFGIGDVGYSNPLKNNLSTYNASDLYFNIGIGYQNSSNPKVRLSTSLAYNYERFKQKQDKETVAVFVLDGLEFNIGFYIDL